MKKVDIGVSTILRHTHRMMMDMLRWFIREAVGLSMA